MFPNTEEGRKKAAGRCYGIYRSSKKADDMPEPSGSTQDFVPQENVMSKGYDIPETIDDLKEGHIVKYKDKLGKIIKIINYN